MIVIGHRGAKGIYPENTLGSVSKAIDLGVDMVEFDVHLCASGEVVVIHDDRLERTTNGTGYVRHKSLEYLRSLNAGQGERIPTLTEMLDLIDRRVAVNVELKGHGTAGPVVKILHDYIQRRKWPAEQFIISTFMRKKLKRLTRGRPGIRIGALLAYRPWGFVRFAQDIGAYSVHLNLRLTSPGLIRQARQAGMKVYVWTVNEPADIERMRAYGVDGIFSDFPDRVR